MGWLKIQKLEYLEDETFLFYEIRKFVTCASNNLLRSYRFVVEVNSKKFMISQENSGGGAISHQVSRNDLKPVAFLVLIIREL